ncbi:cytochrome P450 [Armillaria borealis]|uniref:Cytochrome P450 n=1 Tax=Armillaria borealis TaxID=47425 RepID=A0AA39JI58_9AGAR|nr:cytochrome P450 [Armillaria borealis]
MTINTKALTHILFNAYDYPKPPITCTLLTEVIGQGIIIAEGNEHRCQRKVMSLAFSHSHILQFHDIFLEKATQLRQIWTSECVKSSGKAQIDTVSYLSHLMLDIIALTGFNYKTDSLNAEDTPNRVHRAICELLQTAKEIQTIHIFSTICPILRWIVPNEGRARIQATHETLAHDLGRQLLAEAKMGDTNESSVNDLFSLLARANGSPDVPIDQRMSEADVLSSLLLAGHEMMRHVEIVDYSQHTLMNLVQKKLREELLATSTDTPTVDEMNMLLYLDWVIRETLRVNPPVPLLAHIAGKDDMIPLRQPFKDTRGRLHDSIPIMKGELISIPIMAINRDKSLWGDDALKVISFVLIREFELELVVPCEEIISKSTVVQWLTLKTNPAHSPQIPIFVTVHHKEE